MNTGMNGGVNDVDIPTRPQRRRPVAHRQVTALVIPADPRIGCSVPTLPDTGVALSDAIGGGLLDDAAYGALDSDSDSDSDSDDAERRGYCLYLDEQCVAKRLPLNGRAAALLVRLGWDPRHDVVLRGDVLVVGTTPAGHDVDVPLGVLAAAQQAGLLKPGRRVEGLIDAGMQAAAGIEASS